MSEGTPLGDHKGVLVNTYGGEQFSRDAIQAFPELRPDLERDAGQLHLQIATLAAAVRRSLESGDLALTRRVCTFLNETLDKPRAVSEITNAIAISFVEADELRATDAGRDLLSQMPLRIRTILLEQADRDREGA